MESNINKELNYFFDYCEGNSFAIKKLNKIRNYIFYLKRTQSNLIYKYDKIYKELEEEKKINNEIVKELTTFQVREIEKNEKEKMLQ